MRTKIVNRNNKTYTVTSDVVNGKVTVSLNGQVAKTVWFNPKRKVWFAPYKLNEGNFWVIVYNNNPYLTAGGDSMEEADFLRDYARRPFNLPLEILYTILAIMVPCLAIMLLSDHYGSNVSDILYIGLTVVGYVWFQLFNMAPVASVKKRRLLCLFSLIGPISGALILLLSLA